MRVVFTGHIDHGKSTLVGRLLADMRALPASRVTALPASSGGSDGGARYARLVDTLQDESDREATLQTARAFLRTAKRHYVLFDAPGHFELIKNMITGAACADAALLVIDATQGAQANSKRHATMLSLLGVHQLAVVVNKMDAVNYRREQFQLVVEEVEAFLKDLGLSASAWIPAAALLGGNVVTRTLETPWYRGGTVLDALESFVPSGPATSGPFRMPVQDVYEFPGDSRRVVAGTIEAGRARVGSEVVFHPSGLRTRIQSVEMFTSSPAEVFAGQAVSFALWPPVRAQRGDLVSREGQSAPHVGCWLRVSLFWLGREPFGLGDSVTLKLGTARAFAHLQAINRVLDMEDLVEAPEESRVGQNQLADAVLRLDSRIAFDFAGDVAGTGRFVLVDRCHICGGGIVLGIPEGRESPGAALVPKVS